jgi:hypothetical protein
MYPYHGTGGLTLADTAVAVNFRMEPKRDEAIVGICPTGRWRGTIELWTSSAQVDAADGAPLRRWQVDLTPASPFLEVVSLADFESEALSDLALHVRSSRGAMLTVVLDSVRSRQ